MGCLIEVSLALVSSSRETKRADLFKHASCNALRRNILPLPYVDQFVDLCRSTGHGYSHGSSLHLLTGTSPASIKTVISSGLSTAASGTGPESSVIPTSAPYSNTTKTASGTAFSSGTRPFSSGVLSTAGTGTTRPTDPTSAPYGNSTKYLSGRAYSSGIKPFSTGRLSTGVASGSGYSVPSTSAPYGNSTKDPSGTAYSSGIKSASSGFLGTGTVASATNATSKPSTIFLSSSYIISGSIASGKPYPTKNATTTKDPSSGLPSASSRLPTSNATSAPYPILTGTGVSKSGSAVSSTLKPSNPTIGSLSTASSKPSISGAPSVTASPSSVFSGTTPTIKSVPSAYYEYHNKKKHHDVNNFFPL